MTTASRWTRQAVVLYNATMPRHKVLSCLSVGCFAFAMVVTHAFVAERARAGAQTDAPVRDHLDLTSLNVRLSQRAIHPPKSFVKEVVELPHVRAARARVAPSPQSAILEDDHHTRVLIVSVLEDGRLQAQVLADLDFAQHVPFVTSCSDHRGCAYDRRPITGGLGCVAICILQALDPDHQR